MTTPVLYIQGDAPNSWMPAQDWQYRYLFNAHMVPTPTVAYAMNRGYEYMAAPLYSLSDELPCDNLECTFNMLELSLVRFPYYTNPFGWLLPPSGIPPVGVLVNLTTGTCRFYVFASNPSEFFLVAKHHNGPPKMCQICMNVYRQRMYAGAPVSQFQPPSSLRTMVH